MFMRFRGGAVGHKAMRDWDQLLQREGHGVAGDEQTSDDEDNDAGSGSVEVESEEDSMDEDDEPTGSDGSDNEEDKEIPGDESGDEGDVMADDGEILDDDIFEAEGYGMP
jgi:hypothetical protein